MSDQQRLARGKRYHADDAVVDIVVGHGAVTAEVQGGRPEPYVVTVEADGGTGVPRRSELWVQCTCPDDSGTGTELCKHAVASMFALSDEIAVEPELVDRWRASRRRATPAADSDDSADVTPLDAHRPAASPVVEHDRPAPVIPLHGVADSEPVSAWGDLPAMLRSPAGAAPPDFPELDEIDHRSLRDDLVRQVLDDALDHLHLRWE